MLFTFCGKYLLHVYTLCTCLLVKPHKLSFMFSLLMSVKELMIVTSTLTALTLMAHTHVHVYTCHPGYSGNCCEYTLNIV